MSMPYSKQQVHALRPYFVSRQVQYSRRGLSIMEVLFAIGVLMVGLLGIASVLPVAARNANNALRSDATTAAVENQVSNAAARITNQLTHVDVPNASLVAFQSSVTAPYPLGNGPYSGLSIQLFGYHTARGVNTSYRRVDLSSPPIVKNEVRAETPVSGPIPPGLPAAGYRDLNFATFPPLPLASPWNLIDNDWLFDPIEPQVRSAPLPRPSFCIDPAFLTASGNLRNDTAAVGSRAVNGYDRTQFPCYDLNYNPQVSPSSQLGGPASFAMTPRMYRVGLPTTSATLPSNVVAKAMFSERDDLPLFRPDGELRGAAPGLLVRPVGATVGPTTSQRTGRYSTLITLVPTSMGGRNYEASIVVFDARKLTINDVGVVAATDVFNLAPYVSSRWDNSTAAATTRTYGEEVLGVVTYAPGPITGGVGQLTYVHSAACNPDIGVNDWVMLCRWIPDQAINRFAWYRVSDVIKEPVILTGSPVLYKTTIEVRGGDWLFHPTQVATSGINTGSAGPFNYSPPGAPFTNAYNRRVTTIVKMPRVVAVRTMNITF